MVVQSSAPIGGAAACRVAIIDEQPITRAGMERVVADEPSLTVGASVSSIEEFAALDQTHRHSVAVIAISSHARRSCTDVVTSASRVAFPVVTATWDRQNMLWDAIRAGARGCVTRSCDQDEMLMAVRMAATGALYISADLVGQLHQELGRPAREVTSGLAPREIETARWIATGLTQSQIATRMGLSEATVNTYAKRIRSKLRVSNKAELTRAAIALGYLRDEQRDHAA